MENKFTPGPWEVRNINDRRRGWRISIKQDDPPEPIGDIAHVYMKSGQSHTFTDNADNGTGIANAQLIAAAPELLEACKKVVNNWGNLHPKDRQQLKQAITNAKGKEVIK